MNYDETFAMVESIPLFSVGVKIHKRGPDGVPLPHYGTSFIVTPNFWGTTLTVSQLHGRMPGKDWWKALARRRFPLAKQVRYKRRMRIGYRYEMQPIDRPPYWQLVAEAITGRRPWN